VRLGARSRGFGSVGCSFGSAGGSVSGASGSVAVRASAGSVFLRTGAWFGRVGAREGACFGDTPARSALRGSGPGGGRFGNPAIDNQMNSQKILQYSQDEAYVQVGKVGENL
jgi:hypothetical protein